MTGPQPIETHAYGCRFRSRTEARWAVFFTTLGWRWEFEPEGFELDHGRYLPDFRISGPGIVERWFEVKPFRTDTQDPVPHDERWTDLAQTTGIPVLTVYGMHRNGDGCATEWTISHDPRKGPHAARITLTDGSTQLVGPFWTEPEYTAAWDAASSARFEYGENPK